jgi:sensor histidine kinase YesM
LLQIIVEDTGAGCDPAQLARGRDQGVGLNNVERRLRCYSAGSAYMQIASRLGQGTRVTVILPTENSNESDERQPVVAAYMANENRR